MSKDVVLGIDLGTTNSCVSIVQDGHAVVLANKSGYKVTPSVVAFLEDGRRLIGQIAKRQAVTNPQNTIHSAKRLIGRRYDSPEVKKAKAVCAYEIVEGPHNDVRIKCHGQVLSLQEISAMILLEMKRIAEEYLQHEVGKAVITVPAYFNDGQRKATKDAGQIAGLDVIRIINEPTAAAIAYGFAKAKGEKTVAVYDLGGGTFDISILKIGDDVFKVLATAGDTFLGGEDFDNLIIDHLAEEFQREHQIDLRRDRMSLQRLKDAAEAAKHELSSVREVEINLPFIATSDKGPLHFVSKFSRQTLETLVQPLIDRTLSICERTLKEAGIEKTDLDDVILVGGQTRMPKIQDAVANFFGRSPSKGVHPDEVVAMGAALHGYSLMDEETEMVLLDVTPHALGIRTAGGTFTTLIEANTTVPTRASHIFTTVTDNQRQVRIQVLQGESKTAEEDKLMGEFILEGIRLAPAGEPEIEVTFSIDANGIVHVSAKDLDTMQEQSITVTMSSGLSDEEVREMAKKTEIYEIQLKNMERVEQRIQEAESVIRKVKKLLPQYQKKAAQRDVERIKSMLEKVPSVIESRSEIQIAKMRDEFEKVLSRIKDVVG